MKVSKINCVNNAAFVMNFDVSYLDEDTGNNVTVNDFNSGNYPIDQKKSLDLHGHVPNGALCKPLVHAVLGNTNLGDTYVRFDESSDLTAVYDVTGTTLFFSVNKI